MTSSVEGVEIVHELQNITLDVGEYLAKAIAVVRPIWVLVVTLVNYVLFPGGAFYSAFIALMMVLLIDIITKYYALGAQYGGIRSAIKHRDISSSKLWKGTQRKLVSYFVVMILAGLSVRVTPIPSVAEFLATITYSLMFLREGQSCIENLIDAGHKDLDWFLFILKRKESQVLREADLEELDRNK